MASTPVTAPSFSDSLVQDPSADSKNNNNSDSSSPSPPSPSTSPPPPSKDNNNNKDDGGGGGDDSSDSPPDSSSSDSSPSPPPPSSSPPPSSPPPSPSKSPLPSSPPPSPPKSPPPYDSSPPPPPSSDEKSPSPPPPSNDSKKSPPPTSPSPSPPPTSSSPSPPPTSPSPSPPPTSPSPSPPPPSITAPTMPTFSPPEAVPTPPGAEVTPLPPSTFLPPPPGAVSLLTPPPPTASGGRLSPGGSGSQKPSPSSSSSHNSPQELSTSDVGIIAAIAAGGVIILALVIFCVLCTRKKKTKPYYMDPARPPPGAIPRDYYASQWASPQDHVVKISPPPGMMGGPVGGGVGWGAPPPGVNTSGDFSSGFSGPSPTPNMALGFSKSQFTYDELASATGGFAQSNLLGQGGFGYVHKGVLHDGKEVAVKSLKSGSGQGEREFQAEVEIISRVHHRHLVSLVGYCIADGQRMLVYEFVPNKTLEFHLHGKGHPVMGWPVRLRIALGSAKGLAYLHEDCHPRIIHRDIKAANILLDDNFEAMVADFGLAKLSSENYTHVSTRVMGTFGYLAPEYASSGKLTEKSDVFSFGVMLLELLTGRRPVDTTNRYMEDSLVDWARPLLTKALEDGEYGELVDPRLEGNYVPHEMLSLISCAAASIRHSARRRPKMSQIVRALEGDATLDDLNEGGVKPGQSGMYSTNMDNSYDTGAYNADMMKFRKMVMSSQEFGESSDYGATSEYGLNPSSSSSSEMGNSGPQRQKL